MHRIVSFMARNAFVWRLWVSLGTPLFLFGLLLDIVVTLVRDFLANWRYEWKADVVDWFAGFTEKRRRSLL